jgi:hypothetical protein
MSDLLIVWFQECQRGQPNHRCWHGTAA